MFDNVQFAKPDNKCCENGVMNGSKESDQEQNGIKVREIKFKVYIVKYIFIFCKRNYLFSRDVEEKIVVD